MFTGRGRRAPFTLCRVNAARQQLGRSFAAIREVISRPALRRLQLAGLAAEIGGWAYWIVLSLYAYANGGAVAVGVVGGLRLGGSAIAAPFAGVIADRFPRRQVLFWTDVTRAACLAAAAIADSLHGPRAVVLGMAVLFAIAGTAFRPALSALLPTLCETAEDLTAANVTATALDSTSLFLGPAIGGLVVAAGGTVAGFWFASAALAVSAMLIFLIRVTEKPSRARESAESVLAAALDGLSAITSNRSLLLFVSLFVAQTFVAGALGVLTVVLATSELGLGPAAVGYLNSAIGIGGIVGSVGSVAIIGQRRLASIFGFGVILWGIPLIVIGAHPSLALALVLLAVLGFGNTFVDVSGLTLLQRAVPDRVLARVTGTLESLILASVAAGALVAPFIIEAIGVRWTFGVFGCVLPVAAALSWHRLSILDTGPGAQLGERLRLLEGVPLMAPLPPAQLEAIANDLEEVEVAGGTSLFKLGDAGDRFWIVASGEIVITLPDRELVVLSAGESFGEIALLRDVPRTASADIVTSARLYGLERDLFIAAVTGHADSAAAAETTIANRLGSVRSGALAL
jgi:MFS family permease